MMREVWFVGDNKQIDDNYSKDDSLKIIVVTRESVFKENNIKPLFLIRYEVPKEMFDKVTKSIQ